VNGETVLQYGQEVVTAMLLPLLPRRVVDAVVIVTASCVALFCCMRLSPARAPLGLAVLFLLALAAHLYPLTGELCGDRRDPRRGPPLASSTPLLAVIALYGASWATVIAALVPLLAGALPGPRGRRRLSPRPWPRDLAEGVIATALAGALYSIVASGAAVASLVPTLPALFVAEGALVTSAWGLIAPRRAARRATPGTTVRHGVLEALPALASEPALAFVLAGAVATGAPAAVLAAALPLAALIIGLRWHNTMRRRLERAHEDLGRANTWLQVQAATDSLTGLTNRWAFEQALATRLAESERYGRPLAVLLIDLDAFKEVNDAYGHAAGDEALVAVAGALRRGLRGSDLPARLGGDEFVALLPETDTARALALAERVRAEITTLRITVGAATVQPTASVGAAATTDHSHVDAAGLLAAADRAAYAAKRAGKNTVRLAA